MTLWGGRFDGKPDELMWTWNASISFDQRLYQADVRGGIAYARALARAGLLDDTERDELISGLQRVLNEFMDGTFVFQQEDEDIHTAVERRLGDLVGPVAGKLHTGRSRNDQVATDMRLYLLEEMENLQGALLELQEAIVDQADNHLEVIMPGYTHLQQAQPVLFSHWLMSYFW
jgi:argininosuccinate lyase